MRWRNWILYSTLPSCIFHKGRGETICITGQVENRGQIPNPKIKENKEKDKKRGKVATSLVLKSLGSCPSGFFQPQLTLSH